MTLRAPFRHPLRRACAAGARLFALALALAGATAHAAPLQVRDDDGRTVQLGGPAQRIISLAPHTTELLYAIGAGPRIVATVRYADYPPQAQALPRVGDALLLDLERIAALKPDLVVVWMHGSAARQIDRLLALGLPVFHSESHTLAQVADGMRRLGVLTGTGPAAAAAAAAYDRELSALRAQYAQRTPVRVFYQVWHEPLMTISRHHVLDDAIRTCGGVNVFADQAPLVPTVEREAVLAARPDVIVTAAPTGAGSDGLDGWRRLGRFEVAARNRFVVLDPDLISRQTPRLLQGTRALCEGLDRVRQTLGR